MQCNILRVTQLLVKKSFRFAQLSAVCYDAPSELLLTSPIVGQVQRRRMTDVEPMDVIRRRLQYQSRKRGMLENCILLSTFSAKYLTSFTGEQLAMYDKLINSPSNDWEIYYWATGAKRTPEEFDNDIMDLLKAHTKNDVRQERSTTTPKLI